MSLELEVSRAVTRAHAAERALHDTRPWSMQVGGHRVSARRMFGQDRIVFIGYLPDPMRASARVVLRCGEDIVDVTDVSPASGPSGPGPKGAWTELRHEIVVGV